MASLAIKGNNVRFKEVIEILEMLGGENKHGLTGDESNAYYVIENNEIKCGIYIFGDEPYVFLTVEEFNNKYPYKIGDRVSIPEYESEVRICKMHWDGYEVQYMVYRCDEEEYYSAKELNDYNDSDLFVMDNNLYNKLDFIQEPSADKVEHILGDYEIVEEICYPKTYTECCRILELTNLELPTASGYGSIEIENLQKLLVPFSVRSE